MGIGQITMINKSRVITLLIISIAILGGCSSIASQNANKRDETSLISKKSTEELIQILERAEDADDPASTLFSDVIDELETRGKSASEAAPVIAKAMTYKRHGSVIAGRALIPMGQSAANAIPVLLQNLDNSRGEVRQYSIFSLGLIGKPAECSVPQLANLLWDKDPGARSASASAIEAITGVDLVWEYEELDPELYGSVSLDDPEGSVTQKARAWWQEVGQNINWPTENCVSAE
ncbi:MAG: HEAT repeat domain-containing protein [Anaerolineales bacterium]